MGKMSGRGGTTEDDLKGFDARAVEVGAEHRICGWNDLFGHLGVEGCREESRGYGRWWRSSRVSVLKEEIERMGLEIEGRQMCLQSGAPLLRYYKVCLDLKRTP